MASDTILSLFGVNGLCLALERYIGISLGQETTS